MFMFLPKLWRDLSLLLKNWLWEFWYSEWWSTEKFRCSFRLGFLGLANFDALIDLGFKDFTLTGYELKFRSSFSWLSVKSFSFSLCWERSYYSNSLVFSGDWLKALFLEIIFCLSREVLRTTLFFWDCLYFLFKSPDLMNSPNLV